MSDPFIAEVRIWPLDFAPRGWVSCKGQVLLINQETALFSLIGTTYGGDGRHNFALPFMNGAAPIHWGAGPGLTPRVYGEFGGQNTVALSYLHLPSHKHKLYGDLQPPESNVPGSEYLMGIFIGPTGSPDAVYRDYNPPELVPMSEHTFRVAGQSSEHQNMQPYLTLNFCIAIDGIYPSRP